MSDSTHDLLIRGTAAARVGDVKEALFYLEWLLNMDADLEEKLEAWYWLAKICPDPVEKRKYLEEVLANQPFHLLARRELMLLDGKLDSKELIDPNQGTSRLAPQQNPDIRNFTCSQCGGRMVYTPDGSSLTCEYCESRKRREQSNQADSQDFLLSMATLKGHSELSGTLSGTCPGCGADFMLPGEMISINCPYCDAVFVTSQLETHKTNAPGIIYPPKASKDAVHVIFRNWLTKEKITPPKHPIDFKGVYLPIWAFAMGGEISYRYSIKDDDNRKVETFNASRSILRSDLLVPAGKKFDIELSSMLRWTKKEEKTDYAPDYLADWVAETYTISVADASLNARVIALDIEKRVVSHQLPPSAVDLSFDTHAMMVESYQLGLIPVWIGEYICDDKKETILIDAVHGVVLTDNDKLKDRNSFWDKIIGNGK